MKRQDYISWDEYFMGIALLSAMRSKDNNSQVGACIVSPENKILSLGGTGKDTGKRHPTLGDNVLIGAGAKVLGPVYIGDNVRVGAGSVVLKNLPANATAVGVPAEIVRVGNIKCCPADDLDQQDLPDIVNQRISEFEARLSRLEAEKQGEFPPDKKE